MTVRVQNVSLCPPNQPENPVVHQATLSIPDGELVLVVGRTGSGKSTLLAGLAGLEPPLQGSIEYDDAPLWRKGTLNGQLSRRIGWVDQSPEHHLFAATVQKELEYGLRRLGLAKSQRSDRIQAALAAFDLDADCLEESPFRLSGGQKRRVALASVVAMNPTWLYLDEPTSSLDPKQKASFLQLLQRERQTRREAGKGAIVIATHDLDDLLTLADRVVILDQGTISANTPAAHVLHDPHSLLEAGLGRPICAQLSEAFAARGLTLRLEGVDAASAAEAISVALSERANCAGQRTPHVDLQSATPPAGRVSLSAKSQLPNGIDNRSVRAVTGKSSHTAWTKLDPRAKWVAYACLSTGILLQTRLWETLLAAALTVLLMRSAHLRRAQWVPFTRPFLFVILLSVLVSGIRWMDPTALWHLGRVGFSFRDAYDTGFNLLRVLLVMWLGILLSATTSQLAMKEGLRQTLQALQRVKLPVEAFSLGASLTLRMIPVVLNQYHRFSRIARSRGKSNAKPGRVRVRDLPVLVIPLMVSLFQFGEDVATAMEARGYSLERANPMPPAPSPPLTRMDRAAVILGCLWLLAFLILRWV